MNVTQRFTLLVKGSIDAVLVKFEDPERSLNQLVLDMENELESAKRAVARAMANEDRLRSRIALHEKDMKQWEEASERALKKGDEEGARDMVRRLEQAERQRDRLRDELRTQSEETEEIRESITHMHDRLQKARSRLELLQAQMRQGEARRAINKVMVGVQRANLQSEFDRISERVELQVRGGAIVSETRRRASRGPLAASSRRFRGRRRRRRSQCRKLRDKMKKNKKEGPTS